MNRIRIDLPSSLPFSVSIPIRITDINYGNHAGNQVFFELMHEGRVRFLQQLGYSELNFENAGLIMSDAAIEFKAEMLYGDIAEVQVGIAGISRVAFEMVYIIHAIRNGNSILAAKSKSGIVCFDYNAKKVVQMPARAVEKMKPFIVNTA